MAAGSLQAQEAGQACLVRRTPGDHDQQREAEEVRAAFHWAASHWEEGGHLGMVQHRDREEEKVVGQGAVVLAVPPDEVQPH